MPAIGNEGACQRPTQRMGAVSFWLSRRIHVIINTVRLGEIGRIIGSTFTHRRGFILAILGVNIDHVATVREARKTTEPDPVWAATLAELGGADAITIHLREDRRHIQERDLRILKESVA